MWIGIVVAVIMILLLWTRAAMRGLQGLQAVEKEVAELCQSGLDLCEAIEEASRRRHPELADATHRQLALVLGSPQRFFGFMNEAADFGRKNEKLEDRRVLALLEATTVFDRGNGVYGARINFQLFKELLDGQEG